MTAERTLAGITEKMQKMLGELQQRDKNLRSRSDLFVIQEQFLRGLDQIIEENNFESNQLDEFIKTLALLLLEIGVIKDVKSMKVFFDKVAERGEIYQIRVITAFPDAAIVSMPMLDAAVWRAVSNGIFSETETTQN